MLPIDAGGALVAGWTVAAAETNGFLLRVDSGGNVVWRRKLGGAGNDVLFAIAPAVERGMYAAVGMGPAQEAGKTEGWILTFDEHGRVLGNNRVGGGSVRFTSIEREGDRFLVAGQDVRGDSTFAILHRPNPTSLFVDWRTWSGGPSTRGLAAVPAGGGDAVVVGAVARDGDEGDGFVTRLDARGGMKWTKSFGQGPGRQLAYHLTRTAADSSLLVVGYGDSGDSARGVDGVVARFEADGTERWRTQLGDGAVDRAVHGITLKDGSVVVVGYSRDRAGSDDAPMWTTVLYGLDANGGRTWTRRIGGPGRDSGRWVAAASDGSLWVVGPQVAAGGGAGQAFVARLAAPASSPH